jgi:dethiobiotin synthetase
MSNPTTELPPAFIVTATDTDVGKTFISAMLVLGLGAAYWKPIRTGTPHTDTDWVREHTNLDSHHFFEERYLFSPHISPHAASRLAGVPIRLDQLVLPEYQPLPHLVVEGAGGIMVPINETQTILDVILHLKLPALVVARSALGTINHTTLTVDKLRQNNIPVLGVVMNGPKHASNRQAIEHYAQVPVLAEIEPMEVINAHTLKEAFHKHFGQIKPVNSAPDNFAKSDQPG